MVEKVTVLGSGPAGYTAALYASRADLDPLLVAGPEPGGQLMITTEVENFPGFPEGITGPELMDVMKKQTLRFGTRFKEAICTAVDLSKRPFTLTLDDGKETTQTKTLIIATGATARKLGLPEDDILMGHGLSACATCDGFFFKNKHVAVIGGGDSAMEEANFLTRFASKVTLIHRRDKFRASPIMAKRALENPKIEVIWNAVVTNLLGAEEKKLKGAHLKSTVDNKEWDIELDGMFYSIGHKPNSDLFTQYLTLDETGYIILPHEPSMRTNLEGVFAAGDIADKSYRQAITAAGMGCRAALDAQRFLEEKGED